MQTGLILQPCRHAILGHYAAFLLTSPGLITTFFLRQEKYQEFRGFNHFDLEGRKQDLVFAIIVELYSSKNSLQTVRWSTSQASSDYCDNLGHV